MEIAIDPKQSSQYERILLYWTLHHILCIKNAFYPTWILFNLFKPDSVNARENEKKRQLLKRGLISPVLSHHPTAH